MRYAAVTLDAFGTLIDTGRDVLLDLATQAVRDHGIRMGPEAFLARWDHHFFHRGFLPTLAETTRTSLAAAFRDAGVDADPDPYVDELQRRWLNAKPYPEVPEVLGDLDGVPLAVVSNADDALLRGILERAGLRFDLIVTSEAARSYKPQRRIFEAALGELGVAANQAVHVGDSPEADVAGAAVVGLHTVWVNRLGERLPEGSTRPDHEVRDLRGLPLILRSD